jgi:hypothetical protein
MKTQEAKTKFSSPNQNPTYYSVFFFFFSFKSLEVYYEKYEKKKKVKIILTNSDYTIHRRIISCIVQMDDEKRRVWISIQELRTKQINS